MKLGHSLNLIFIIAILLSISCNTNFTIRNGKTGFLKHCRGLTTEQKIEYLTKIINKNPDNAFLFYERGSAYFDTYKYSSAISDLTKVIELEPGNISAYYALSKAASITFRREYALYCLQKALEAGYNDFSQLSNDPGFDNIRNMEKFKKLMKKWGWKSVVIKR